MNRWAIESGLAPADETLPRPDQLRRAGFLPCDLRSEGRRVDDLNHALDAIPDDLVGDDRGFPEAEGIVNGLLLVAAFYAVIWLVVAV